jgi:hypothetical protein
MKFDGSSIKHHQMHSLLEKSIIEGAVDRVHERKKERML